MAIVNKVNKRVKMGKDDVIKYQILTHCFLNDIQISNSDLECLSELAKCGTKELTLFCEDISKKGIFKSAQSCRNALTKAEKKKLIIKNGSNKKTISINVDMNVQTEGTLLLDDVLNPEASGSTLFIRTQKELDKILKQYKNTADEQYTSVKQKYNNLTTGAGYLRKPTSDWKNIKSGSNVVFGYKNKTAAADEFYNSIPRDLRIRLQGQSPTGGFAGKEEIKFTFE